MTTQQYNHFLYSNLTVKRHDSVVNINPCHSEAFRGNLPRYCYPLLNDSLYSFTTLSNPSQRCYRACNFKLAKDSLQKSFTFTQFKSTITFKVIYIRQSQSFLGNKTGHVNKPKGRRAKRPGRFFFFLKNLS